MSFLAPLFLLGALAVSLPILFHLIRRTTRQRMPFSSLLFLMPTPPRLTKRSRLEHFLLLALRCAALVLLAFGFARPFFKTVANPAAGSVAKRFLFLVDTSASMRRATLWADARERFIQLLRATSPIDQVAVFTFDRQVTPLVTYEEWNASSAAERVSLAERKLADAAPGWSATYLGNALIRAAETAADSSGKQPVDSSEIVVISDLQEGSHLEPLQGYEWPRGVSVTFESLKPKHSSNASLQLITDSDDASAKAAAGTRVRVSNSATAKAEQFKVGWAADDGAAFAGTPMDIYVPQGQSRIVSMPTAMLASRRILLRGDDEDFDNSVFVVPPEAQRLQVLYFGTDSDKDATQPLYFLQRAFQETRRQAVQVRAGSATAPFTSAQANATSLYIVTDPVPEGISKALRDEAMTGKTVLVAPKSEACASTLAQLLQIDNPGLREVHPSNYAMLADIDFAHPLFAPFADPRFSDFTKIHFWKYRRIDSASLPGARVLARFDTGDPALLEVPLGKGRILVMASGWQPEDSQLALSTKFVPLLYSMLEQSGALQPAATQYQVGDAVPLPSNEAHSTLIAHTPAGKQVELPAGQASFSETDVPGIYTVASGPAAAESTFAVNLDPTESRTAPLPTDEFERLGVPVPHQVGILTPAAKRQARLQNTELENRQKLWRWLILGTLAVLLTETYVAGRAAQRASRQTQPATAT